MGIRKAAATADAESAWTDAELDAKFGWTGRKMASHYTRTASRERLSIAAAERTKKGTSIPETEGQGAGASEKNRTKSKAERYAGGPGRTRTCNQTVMSGRL
jgi:hypothetical protein